MSHSSPWPYPKNESVARDTDVEEIKTTKLEKLEGQLTDMEMELQTLNNEKQNICTIRHPNQTVIGLEHGNSFINDISNFESTQYVVLTNKCVKAPAPEVTTYFYKSQIVPEERKRDKYEYKLNDLEQKLDNIYVNAGNKSSKDHLPADYLNMSLKTEIREMKEEIEELRQTLQEQDEQIQDYRNKYLQAEQQAVEYRKQLDIVDYDNKQVSDQIQFEIHKMKMQFQEKLQELAPLPDLLKGVQIQLEEAKQLQKLAEDSSAQISSELNRVKEKLVQAVNNLNQEKKEKHSLLQENQSLKENLSSRETDLADTKKELLENKTVILRLDEKLRDGEERLKEKITENSNLINEINYLKLESSRCINRSKDRSEASRRNMLNQISDLERKLVQSRAEHVTCLKERDELRQKMQLQVSTLQENFEMIESKLRNLQIQIVSMKNSYPMILDGEELNSNFVLSTNTEIHRLKGA